MDEELKLARQAAIRSIINEVREQTPEDVEDPWELADTVMGLWKDRFPDAEPIDEDDVFAAALGPDVAVA